MLLHLFHKRGKRGFTLVELLIVVAIVGVLSTVGIPTFRRMVQKSKKSEAKVNLGGVYTAEAAFNAEYNYYGNNIMKMGFEIDGSQATLIYTVGFFNADCTEQTVEPSATTPTAVINAAFPSYYTEGNTRTGQTTATVVNGICGGTGVGTINAAAGGGTFIAGAAGMIAPPSFARNSTNMDVWTINNGRVLANTQDGVK
jgi:prepilin-type N-terminal cleavage/methylation domain-containing protein